MSISKHNKSASVFTFDGDTRDWPYRSLADLAEWENAGGENPGSHVYVIRKFFLSKGKYGEQYVGVVPAPEGGGALVNFPAHLTDYVEEIIEDQETVDQINAGKAGFRLRSYEDRNGDTRWSVLFVDL